MFILIHGEDQVKTRAELQTQISKAKQSDLKDIVTLDGKTESLPIIIQNIESNSLFGINSRLTIIENLHKKRSKTELKEIVTYLSHQESGSINLIIWENHELTPGQVKALSNATVLYTKLSPIIFKLTDALTPSTPFSKILGFLKEACKHDSPEMVITMLARQVRLMIQSFDDEAKLSPWQKGKLTTAGRDFGLNRLIEFHHQLTLIDYNNKTGRLPTDLQSELAYWLTSLYTKKYDEV